jgi:hypothetical protein
MHFSPLPCVPRTFLIASSFILLSSVHWTVYIIKLFFRFCNILQAPFTFVIIRPNSLLAPCSQIITLCSSCMWQDKFRSHIKQQVNYSFTCFNIYVVRYETAQSSFPVTGLLGIAADVPSIYSDVFLHTEFEAFSQYRVGSRSRIFCCYFLSVPILTSWEFISRKLLQHGLTSAWLARKLNTSQEHCSMSSSKTSALPKQLSYLKYVNDTS